MLDWLRRIFYVSCPACGSLRVREVPTMTMTYNIYYECGACEHRWKESGL